MKRLFRRAPTAARSGLVLLVVTITVVLLTMAAWSY